MIRDPQFWKRFSVAVHQDDLEKEIMTAQDTKNPYVTSSSLSSPAHSPLGSPTSQTHLSSSWSLPAIGYPPMVQLGSLRSSCIVSSPLSPLSPSDKAVWEAGSERKKSGKEKKEKQRSGSKLQKTSSMKPLLRPDISVPTTQPAPSPTTPPQQQEEETNPLPRPFFRTPNLSTLSLSRSLAPLSGRPASRFKFVTTITADAPHRDSWLARQKKKERHRTWICWAFWTVFLLLIAGVVVTVLVLKAHEII
ncbi:hypothetical protein DDE82_005668 [Stemphylium lycopersici]|uniref:Uncharacterized protein n=1 Tax=Stemphylium lycopersici TaxID=183478 RepID=A0A364N706_STELY|nr:hypothetical protein TW65_09109 [Stemphylium lycopersici]RAR02580.1 hypothetical protein DDE82_005668 [Stemphylium lycopersici]RAR13104.1 hypothetical protein DDE83_003489 [Stemphylium lycopersici]